MVGHTKKKLISSLSQKKYRDKHGLFVAEGPKLINDLLISRMQPELIFTTDASQISPEASNSIIEVITPQELQKLSFLKTPQNVLGVFKKPFPKFRFGQHSSQLSLCLDGIQDPGNLGTIIRLADWFDIRTIVCSEDTADVFNPKVVQASMGAIARVKIIYTDLPDFCQKSVTELNMQVFGTFMDGNNIYTMDLPSSGLIIMGNEGRGIRPETAKLVTQRITVPSFSDGGMESLNVGIAAAIVCSEFRRGSSL
ncbi:RNA methyltransferase [Marinilabilia sp.]|uniref:TrmH family RNA methyltransferase n=1 Tax=Marinilabilia sp. TaxID=2021252 RepID=UPI0025BA669A|nr:RNA methyltransferase [Marinilabilia sp.]